MDTFDIFDIVAIFQIIGVNVVYKIPYRRAPRLACRLHRVYRTKKLAPTIVGANRLRNISKKLNAAQSVFEVFIVKLKIVLTFS